MSERANKGAGAAGYAAKFRAPFAVLGIRTGRGDQTLWSPPGARQLLRTDRLIVLATRDGLSWLTDATSPGC